ncbi:zinc finger protein GAI-ASSOCIATED FACTOR 1-like [Aristolochia californica]|uniref:zinc finger protein GAI-ASSOCIATED FACTOR 1-like n=1 Tax=Aristolochia californica TaxID=171875 RepID=UPI0035D6AEEA
MSSITPEGLLGQTSLGSSATPDGSAGEDSAATVHKKKRNHPGNPDPDAEVVALSPGTLMATNRYMCEVCHKGFQREQNLQLHRRGHNLPWKLKQRSGAPVKRRVYICPEMACPHHDPSRALGDLTGIKKHFCRKHGEKKWKCDKCSKRYAVQSDWKAHAKICGTREYRCDCGTIFSRRDSFITHRAFCDALAEENYKMQQGLPSNGGTIQNQSQQLLPIAIPTSSPSSNTSTVMNLSVSSQNMSTHLRSSFMNPPGIVFSGSLDLPLDSIASQTSSLHHSGTDSSTFSSLSGSKNTHMAMGSAFMSATALLQKAAEMGAMVSDNSISPVLLKGFAGYSSSARSCGSVQEKSSQNSGVLQNGLLDTHMFLQSVHRNEENSMGGFMGGMQKGFQGSERTAADFLSLGPVGHINTGETGHRDATNGLGYAAEQEDFHNLNSYGHASCGRSPLEKPMWNF